MIIEYWIHSGREGCWCCGRFDNHEAFDAFKRVEAFYGRVVSKVIVRKAQS